MERGLPRTLYVCRDLQETDAGVDGVQQPSEAPVAATQANDAVADSVAEVPARTDVVARAHFISVMRAGLIRRFKEGEWGSLEAAKKVATQFAQKADKVLLEFDLCRTAALARDFVERSCKSKVPKSCKARAKLREFLEEQIMKEQVHTMEELERR